MQIRTLVAACGATLAASVLALVSGAHFAPQAGGAAPDLGWLATLPSEETHGGTASVVTRVSPFGQGPARFEPNLGQAPGGVRWMRRGPADVTFLGDDSFTTVVHGRFARPFDADLPEVPHGVRMRFAGGAMTAAATPEGPLACVTNYLRGPDPARWLRNVPNFTSVRYAEVWPGTDVVFHGQDGRMEYDFVLAPGADAAAIALDVDGADAVRIDEDGDLVLDAGPAEIRHKRPLVWQDTKAGRRKVECAFVLEEGPRVRFRLTGRDASLPAVIDPLVVISRRFGGSSNDAPTVVATTTATGILVGGITQSFDLVGVGPLAGDFSGLSDAFVAKFEPTTVTITATAITVDIMGGIGDDGVTDLRVARNGEIFVSCYTTDSPTFLRVGGPTVPNLAGVDAVLVRLTPDARTPIVAFPFGGAGTDLCTNLALEDDAPSTVTITAVFAGMLSTSQSLPGFGTLAAGRNAVVTRHNPDGTQTAAHLAGAPGLNAFAPVSLDLDGANSRLFLATSGARDGFTTTPGAFLPTTTAIFPGFVESLSLDLTQRNAATFFTGQVEATILSVASVPGGDVGISGAISGGFLQTTSNSAFPPVTGGQRGFLATLSGDLTIARTISNIGGPGSTYGSTVIGVTTTAVGSTPGRPELVVVGQSNALTPVGGGTAYHGAFASGPPDVFHAVAPAAGGVATNVSFDGSTAAETTNVGIFSGRNVEFGRFGALRLDGSLVLAYQTLADVVTFPELAGPFGGAADMALRTVTTTVALVPPPLPPKMLDLVVVGGTLTDPKKPSQRGKVSMAFTLADPLGPLDLGLKGPGTLDLDVYAPISPTFTAGLSEFSVALSGGTLSKQGRVQTIHGKISDGTKFVVVLDARKDPARITLDLTNVPGMFKPYGTPLLHSPLYVKCELNNAISGELVRGTPLSGGRQKIVDYPTDLLWKFDVTPGTVRHGRPNFVRGWFENPGLDPRVLSLTFRHKGFPIFSTGIALPGRDLLTGLPGLGFATTTATTPGTGSQKWELEVDGVIVGSKKTTTTK